MTTLADIADAALPITLVLLGGFAVYVWWLWRLKRRP